MKESTVKLFETYLGCVNEAKFTGPLKKLKGKKVVIIDKHGDEIEGKLVYHNDEKYFEISGQENTEFHDTDVTNVDRNLIKLKISLT